MSAILHSITTDIENSRMKDNIKYWRWMSNIFHNKQDTMNHLCNSYLCIKYFCDLCENKDCKQYCRFRNDNCNCGSWYCGYCNDSYAISKDEEEDEDEYEYSNCGTQPDGSYVVTGGGMMNGNAYATVENKEGKYYYCEYGPTAYRKYIGSTIIWSDERQDDGCGEFNIE